MRTLRATSADVYKAYRKQLFLPKIGFGLENAKMAPKSFVAFS